MENPPRTTVATTLQSSIAMLVIALVIRLAWGWHLHRQLEQQMAQLRADGMPTSLSEYSVEPVADADNAWPLIMQACTARKTDSPRLSDMPYAGYPPFSDEWKTMARASEADNAAAFELMRQARLKPKIDPGIHYASSASASLSSLNTVRQLAKIFADSAQLAEDEGRDADAFDRLESIYFLARATRQNEFIVGQLLAIGIDALATGTVEEIAAGLGRTAKQPVSCERVQSLIAMLLNEVEEIRARESESFKVERASILDLYAAKKPAVWMTRPLLDRNEIDAVRSCQLSVEAALVPNKPAMLAGLKRDAPDWKSDLENSFRTFADDGVRYSRWFAPTAERFWMLRYLETGYRSIGERRLAAVSLAAQLYRLDHGALPERLDQLVPNYLPSIPLDPYGDERQAIGFAVKKRYDGQPRPMIFHEGGIDSADDDSVFGTEPSFGWYQDRRISVSGFKLRENVRQYRDLTRFPSAETVAANAALNSSWR